MNPDRFDRSREADRFDKARRRLLDEIAADARDTAGWTGRAAFSAVTMAAIERVPRHAFVRPEDASAAYANRPQSIGCGQTISQPYIVALMTDLLDLEGGERVLEIGTGSGYQAAVLAETGAEVFSLETVERLAKPARARLDELGYDRVRTRVGDGYLGWPEEGPFDGILVTAAPERVPAALIDQLKPMGRMVVPIGRPHQHQMLTLVRKDLGGTVSADAVLPVAFVPMVAGRPRDLD